MSRLILMSDGLSTVIGRKLVKKKIYHPGIEDEKILLIVPFRYDLKKGLIRACDYIGFKKENVVYYQSPSDLVLDYDYIYVTEGNAFMVLSFMKEHNLIPYIKEKVLKTGITYIGASAGAVIAGIDIKIAIDFDDNKIGLKDFKSLGLFRGTIIPHYTSSERKNYIRNSEVELLKYYTNIYSVNNGKVLILNTDL